MIKTTRLATEQEKSVIIAYLQKTSPQEADSDFFTWSETNPSKKHDWNSASFVVLEVKDLEEKIVIVNQVMANSSDALDIATNHYLLSENNDVIDISHTGLYL